MLPLQIIYQLIYSITGNRSKIISFFYCIFNDFTDVDRIVTAKEVHVFSVTTVVPTWDTL